MTRQTYRASSYQDRPHRDEGSILDKAVWHDDELGFRLAVDTDVERVNRGGCWYGAAPIAHLSFPDANDPMSRNSNLGFRLAKEGT